MRLAVVLIGFVLTVGAAYAHPPSDSGFNKIRISDYLSPVNRPVFYVQIFGNDFPIPTRFELRLNERLTGGYATFRSPSGYIMKEEPTTGAVNPNLLGTIIVGSYSKSTLTKIYYARSSDVVRSLRCYGLNVTIRKATKGLRASIHQVSVLIHNKKMFIYLIGESNSLPKSLLHLYGALNGVSEGNNCVGW